MLAKRKGKIVNIASIAGMRMAFFGSIDDTVSKDGTDLPAASACFRNGG
jgi:hypothetical protein